MATLKAGNEKHNSFCEAFYEYKLGKTIMQAAREVMERNASDILGDSTFDAGVGLMSTAKKAAAAPVLSAEDVGVCKQQCDKANGKIMSSLSLWSAARTEEQWSRITDFVKRDMFGVIKHGLARAIASVTVDTKKLLETAGVAGEEWWNVGWADAGEEKHSTMEALRPVVAMLRDIAPQVREMLAFAQGCSSASLALCKKIVEIAKVSARERQALLEHQQAQAQSVTKVCNFMCAATQGMLDCEALLTADGYQQAQIMLASYREWMEQTARQEEADDEEPEDVDGAQFLMCIGKTPRPLLAVGVSLCQALVMTSDDIEAELVSLDLGSSAIDKLPTSKTIAEGILQWLARSPVAKGAFGSSFTLAVERCVQYVVEITGVMSTKCADKNAFAAGVDKDFLSLLIRQDISHLAQEGLHYMGAMSGAASIMPHTRAAIVLKGILEEIQSEDGFLLPSLQHCVDSAASLPSELIAKLITLYSQMKSAMCAAAVASECIFGAAGSMYTTPAESLQVAAKATKVTAGLRDQPIMRISNLVLAIHGQDVERGGLLGRRHVHLPTPQVHGALPAMGVRHALLARCDALEVERDDHGCAQRTSRAFGRRRPEVGAHRRQRRPRPQLGEVPPSRKSEAQQHQADDIVLAVRLGQCHLDAEGVADCLGARCRGPQVHRGHGADSELLLGRPRRSEHSGALSWVASGGCYGRRSPRDDLQERSQRLQLPELLAHRVAEHVCRDNRGGAVRRQAEAGRPERGRGAGARQ